MLDDPDVNYMPGDAVVAAVTAAAGRAPVAWRRVQGGGYTPAERWLVTFGDGTTGFAKVGTIDRIGEWLRIEHRAYREIAGPFIPRMLGWADGPVPALILEDLTGGHWPPPWSGELVDRMLETLAAIAATPCPEWARPVASQTEIFSGWSRIAEDPAPFLGLGLVSAGGLEGALPTLVAHESPGEVAGDALLHFDVRSDNMCFTGERTLLVDWNWIGRGSPLFDVAAWLPSLHFEGGPRPEDVSAEAGVFAAALAGYFCAQGRSHSFPMRHMCGECSSNRRRRRCRGLRGTLGCHRSMGGGRTNPLRHHRRRRNERLAVGDVPGRRCRRGA
ncbi:MAG: phosphotransferase, partial [Gemmatimonadales bacterium]